MEKEKKRLWYFYDELILLFLLDYHKRRIYPSLRSACCIMNITRGIIPDRCLILPCPGEYIFEHKRQAPAQIVPGPYTAPSVLWKLALVCRRLIAAHTDGCQNRPRCSYIQIKSCQITRGHNNIFTHAPRPLAEECRGRKTPFLNSTFVFQRIRPFRLQLDCIREMHLSTYFLRDAVEISCAQKAAIHLRVLYVRIVVSISLRVWCLIYWVVEQITSSSEKTSRRRRRRFKIQPSAATCTKTHTRAARAPGFLCSPGARKNNYLSKRWMRCVRWD
jgi:hypothetical protein